MKSIIKTILSALLIASLLFTCVSCASNAEQNKISSNTFIGDIDTNTAEFIYFPEKEKTKISGFAEFASDVFSSTIPELAEKSDVIILGDVVGERVNEEITGDCIADISVRNVWKGNLKENDVISVHEDGAKFADWTDATIGGEPLLRKDMRVILFLFQPDYGIEGCFQGKFFLNNDGNVYSYEYFSNEYNDKYFSDVHESISYKDFKAILDSLSDTVGEDSSETLSPDSDIAFPDKDAGKPNIIV